MDWTWDWVAAVGYDRYSFGDNIVVDVLRVACVVAGVMLAVAVAGVLRESRHRTTHMPRTQYLRFVALGAADLYISLTEVAVVGSPGTPRLLMGMTALAVGAVGVHGMREKQKRQPVKDVPRRLPF